MMIRKIIRNKKGQSWGINIISALMIFLIGMTAINILKPEITNARTDLNCGNAGAISDGTKILCLIVDFTMFYFILTILSLAAGIILARLNI